MRILGVDPGLRTTGYGLISVADKNPWDCRIDLVEAGVIRTATGGEVAGRLKKIYGGLSELVTEHDPDLIVIEKLYAHYQHPTTAILMGHARGVVCLLSGMHGVKLASIASTHVKKAVVGNGHAGKSQVQRAVQAILGLRSMPEPEDAADALAIAIAYLPLLRRKI